MLLGRIIQFQLENGQTRIVCKPSAPSLGSLGPAFAEVVSSASETFIVPGALTDQADGPQKLRIPLAKQRILVSFSAHMECAAWSLTLRQEKTTILIKSASELQSTRLPDKTCHLNRQRTGTTTQSKQHCLL